MRKNLLILFFVIFPFLIVLGQKKKINSMKEQAIDDVNFLTTRDFPYIETFHRALREKISKNYSEAEKLFDECLKIRQDDDAVYFALAEIYKMNNKSTKALEYYEKAYQIDSENINYLQEMAAMQFEKANFDEAGELFVKLCNHEPRNLDYRYAYMQALIYNKNYATAIEQIDILQEQVGMIPELMNIKADLFIEQKKFDDAEKVLLQLNNEFPDDTDILNDLISFYEKYRKSEDLIEFIEQLVKENPDNGTINFVLAFKYLEQNKITEFVKVAKKIFYTEELSINQKLHVFEQLKSYKSPDDSMMVLLIGKLYEDYPENEYVSLNYSNSLVAQRKTKKSLEIFRKTIHKVKDDYEAWQSVLAFESKFLEYLALYEDGAEALTLFPTMPYTYFAASEGTLYVKGAGEALELLSAGEIYIIDDKKMESDFAMRKGQIYFHNKEYKNGIREFEKAISLSDNPNIKLNYALALIQAGIVIDVAQNIISEIEEKDKNSTFYKVAALIELNTGNIEKGIQILNEGKTKVFHNMELYDLLGDLFFKNQETEKAVEAWKAAQELESRNKVLNKKIEENKYYAPKYY